jgi:putative endonuclease
MPSRAMVYRIKFGMTNWGRTIIMKQYYVYIMASGRNGTLYTGVTNNLERRVQEHKQGLVEGFTHKYNVNLLVWFEGTVDVNAAIQREKQLKNWHRSWKLALIEKNNPQWKDLTDEW